MPALKKKGRGNITQPAIPAVPTIVLISDTLAPYYPGTTRAAFQGLHSDFSNYNNEWVPLRHDTPTWGTEKLLSGTRCSTRVHF